MVQDVVHWSLLFQHPTESTDVVQENPRQSEHRQRSVFRLLPSWGAKRMYDPHLQLRILVIKHKQEQDNAPDQECTTDERSHVPPVIRKSMVFAVFGA